MNPSMHTLRAASAVLTPAANASTLNTAVQAQATRVALVLPTYLPESFGGAEQQSRKLGWALSRRGVHVTLLAPRVHRTTARTEQDGPLSLRRFHVRQLPNLGGRHMASFLWWCAQLFWWLMRNRHTYDVIHIMHGRLHALPAVIAGTVLRKPTLVKIGRGGKDHFDLDLLNGKRLLGPWYAKVLTRHVTGYVANSRIIVEDLQRWQIDPRRIYEIPNGVEIPPLAQMAPRQDTRFIFLGRLDPEKSVDLMIRGFARLGSDARAVLTIVGDGTCRRELEALAQELSMGNRVRFTGAVTDTARELRDADVFVSCSSSEGMSNALLEAMSFGVMPLVSLVSGASDIVTDERSGLLFAPGDLDAFVARLQTALSMPPETRRAFGMNARAAVEGRFGIEQVAERHIGLYHALKHHAVQIQH